ncbi:ribonuclease P protein component [Pseudopelagicola sp. nBUS_19]|uniref:ribonuclease P protein component n=1 Tax=Pseudopelagicola sp. nBUS_19 TaxID=3395316 RepID=UPI003EBACAC8
MSCYSSLNVIKKRRDFVWAARAKSKGTRGMMLQARARGTSENVSARAIRVGYTCSKKVGNAVLRNRAKRRLREVARIVLSEYGHPGWDYVLIGRAKETATRDFQALQSDLQYALRMVHIINR